MLGKIIVAMPTSGKTTATESYSNLIDQDAYWGFWIHALGKDGWAAVKDPSELSKFRKDVLRLLSVDVEAGRSVLIWDIPLARALHERTKAEMLIFGVTEGEYVRRSLERYEPGGSKSNAPKWMKDSERLRKSWFGIANEYAELGEVQWLDEGQYLSDELSSIFTESPTQHVDVTVNRGERFTNAEIGEQVQGDGCYVIKFERGIYFQTYTITDPMTLLQSIEDICNIGIYTGGDRLIQSKYREGKNFDRYSGLLTPDMFEDLNQ